MSSSRLSLRLPLSISYQYNCSRDTSWSSQGISNSVPWALLEPLGNSDGSLFSAFLPLRIAKVTAAFLRVACFSSSVSLPCSSSELAFTGVTLRADCSWCIYLSRKSQWEKWLLTFLPTSLCLWWQSTVCYYNANHYWLLWSFGELIWNSAWLVGRLQECWEVIAPQFSWLKWT